MAEQGDNAEEFETIQPYWDQQNDQNSLSDEEAPAKRRRGLATVGKIWRISVCRRSYSR